MKVGKQKALIPHKQLREAISKNQSISYNWFAWNIFQHPERDQLLPLYIKTLEASSHKKDAKRLLAKLVKEHKKIQPDLPLDVLEQVERVAKSYRRTSSKDKKRCDKRLDAMERPLTEFAEKAKDRDYLAEIKWLVNIFSRKDRDIVSLKRKLTKDMEKSYSARRIVDIPGCQKSLYVPHPYSDALIGRYFDTVLAHKMPALITLCSPYEHKDVVPFWEDREVVDPQGRPISCRKLSETVLYKSETMAKVRDETRLTGVVPEDFYPRVVERRLQITRGDEQFETVHLHYENWPDHQEAPDIEGLELLLDRKDALVGSREEMIMVNCKAAIGRSGAFFNADCGRGRVQALVEEGIPFDQMSLNMGDMMRKVRYFRPILSGNVSQLSQAMECIARYYQSLQKGELK
ncbi:MAG: hypothetical protein JSS12_01070 [Verrucomicrobia bacterium]|nr:hypothetical protein [Verrucomicrobiota bacterium]